MNVINVLSENPDLRIGKRKGNWKINTDPYSPELLVKVTETFFGKVLRFLAYPFKALGKAFCRAFYPKRINEPLDLKVAQLFSEIQNNFQRIPEKNKVRILKAVRLNLDQFNKLNISLKRKEELESLKIAFDKTLSDLDLHYCADSLLKLIDASAKAKMPIDQEVLLKAEHLLNRAIQNDEHEIAVWLVTLLGKKVKHVLDAAPQSEFYDWLRKLADHVPQNGAVPKENLDFYALELGSGYKVANLMAMRGVLQKIAPKLKHCDLDIPSLVPIYDAQTWQFLSKQIPNLQEEFEQFLNSFDPDVKAKFLSANTPEEARQVSISLSVEGKQILKRIREQIIETYTKSLYLSPVIDQWLNTLDGNFVIVRSTGREDSEKNSNAGGNASIPNVRPNAEAISKAMGEVVASYFGETSLTQRLQAGDQSIFSEKPFLPVLIQQMVSEKNIGGIGSNRLADLPRCGVFFTQEHGKADGVTVVNAAFGSNEGVVTSMVAVDTYEISPSGIYSVLRNKPTRFVHLTDQEDPSKFVVGPVENPFQIRDRAVLSSAELKDLKIVADYLASFYGDGSVKPMDAEYGLLTNEITGKTTIYLFQIRPLLKPATAPIAPSFLNLARVKQVPEKDRETASVFMTGSPNVRTITAPLKQVIFAEDLPEALAKFEQCDHVQEIQLIVIKKPAAITSHPAVVLRPTNIPIFVISDPDQWSHSEMLLQKASPENPVLACPQRGIVIQQVHQDLIKQGLVSYPGPLELSLPSRFFSSISDEKVRNKAKFQFLEKIEKETLEWCPAHKFHTDSSLEDLFDMMALGEPDVAKLALGEIFFHLIQTTKNIWVKAEEDKNNFHKQRIVNDLFDVLDHAFTIAKYNVIPALEKYPPQSMNRLMHLQKLRALIFQSSDEIIANHSFKSVAEAWQMVTKNLSKIAKALGIPLTPENSYLLTLRDYALTDEIRQKWDKLVKAVSKNKDQQSHMLEMCKTLTDLNIFIPWINIVFAKTGKESTILKNYHACGDVLKQIQQRFVKIEQLEHQISEWENPAFVEKNLHAHVALFQKELKGLQNLYNSTNDLGKFAILSFLQTSLTKYDRVIKSVTGSKQYKDKREQARHVHALLLEYLSFLKIATSMAKEEERTLMTNGYGSKIVSFEDYISSLEKGRKNYTFGFAAYRRSYENKFSSLGLQEIGSEIASMSDERLVETLSARNIFNVSAIVIGSRADLNFSAHWPSTLEEHFTTIHQSSEAIFRHLQTKLGFNEAVLPEHISAFTSLISEKMGNAADITVQNKTVEVRYQIPLRQHAASLMITAGIEPNTPVFLTVSAYGNEEYDRWKQAAFLSAALVNRFQLKYANGAHPSIDYRNPKGVSFTIEIPPDHPANRIDLYEKLASMLHEFLFKTSMDGYGGDELANVFRDRPAYHPLKLTDKKTWLKLPAQTYEQSFFMGVYAMKQAWAAQDFHTLVSVAEHTLLGLKHYDMKDYEKPSSRFEWIVECRKDPALSYFNTDNIPKIIFAALIMASRKDPSLMVRVKEIFNNPSIAQYFSEEAQQAALHVLDPQKEFDSLVKQDQIAELLIFARKSEKTDWIERAQKLFEESIDKNKATVGSTILQFIKASSEKVFQNGYEPLLEIAMAKGQLQAVVDHVFPGYQENLDKFPSQLERILTVLEWIQKHSESSNMEDILEQIKIKQRKLLTKSLEENLTKLRTNEANSVAAAKDILIGLLQHTNPLAINTNTVTTSDDQQIGSYLGSPQYRYFPDNQYRNTTRYHKIATFTLLRALENDSAQGYEALDSLIADFLDQGYQDPGATPIKEILFGLAYAGLKSIEFSAERARIARTLWRDRKDIATEFYQFVESLDTDQMVLPHLILKMRPFPLEEKGFFKRKSLFNIFTGPTPYFDLDSKAFTTNQIKTVVTLLSKEEMMHFGLPEFYKKQNLSFIHYPIKDFKTPPSVEEVDTLIDKILQVRQEGNLYVHCRQGRGRTGMIMACLIAKTNPKFTAKQVIEKTRETIPFAIETPDQEKFVEEFVEFIKNQ